MAAACCIRKNCIISWDTQRSLDLEIKNYPYTAIVHIPLTTNSKEVTFFRKVSVILERLFQSN